MISVGEGYAPPRWARAKGQEETFYQTPGPSITDAAAWSATPGASAQGLDRTVYYLVAAVDGLQFAFKAYQGAPSGGQLAQDLVAAISGHKNLSEVTLYTKATDQKKLAQEAIGRIGTETQSS